MFSPDAALPSPPAHGATPPKLLDRVQAALRAHQVSESVIRDYVAWIKRYSYFHQLRHPHLQRPVQFAAFRQEVDGRQEPGRTKVARQFPDTQVRQGIELDLTVIDCLRVADVELYLQRPMKVEDPQTITRGRRFRVWARPGRWCCCTRSTASSGKESALPLKCNRDAKASHPWTLLPLVYPVPLWWTA
jgi:hypothetical protein